MQVHAHTSSAGIAGRNLSAQNPFPRTVIGLEQMERETPELSAMARQDLHKVAGIATEVSSDIHNLSHELHPSKLIPFAWSWRWIVSCQEFSKQHGLKVKFIHDPIQDRIANEVTLCIFRIAQEALRNVVKHSGASEAGVKLGYDGKRIDLCVSDLGAGFDLDLVKGKAGIGLISIRERLRLVGGTLIVESRPSEGTRIHASVGLTRPGDPPTQKRIAHSVGSG
jgi:signal transduction histidine kinase